MTAQRTTRPDGVWLSRAFDATAGRYDLMVGLNPGYHEHLDDAVSGLVASRPARMLDLGCGSGASTAALVRAVGADTDATIVGIDASPGMLEVARRKQWPRGVRFVVGRAEDLDAATLPVPVDAVIAAYLFRNVADRDRTLAAVHDALAPGGRLVVQDYSVAGSRRARLLWTVVCWTVIIPLSLVLTGRTRLYRYLWRSVLDFDSTSEFADRLRAAGFEIESIRTVGGWQRDILHTFHARRPR